jgi:hypothetical protein
LQKQKCCAALLILSVLACTILLSLGVSALMQSVSIINTGEILYDMYGVYARGGSAKDIQAAVNQVVSTSGIGNVYIPAGNFNFVEVGEPWMTVNVPAGVNIFGATTQRDSNGQVIEWRTRLVMPYEVPTSGPNDNPAFFEVELDESDTSKSFRFSDVALVGWRFFDHNSTTMYTGVKIYTCSYTSYATAGMQDIRVDHCNFQDMAGFAINFQPDSSPHNRRPISGVIDHNRMVNNYGNPGRVPTYSWEDRTITYGISLGRWASDVWDSNLANVIGQYTNYTVFIENNYFSKWRHCVASNHGMHYVFRYNIVEGDYGTGSIDAHGSYADAETPYAVGTRAIEVYENIFRNPDTTWFASPWAINLRGGSGVIFNNILEGYSSLIFFNNEYGNSAYLPKCSINSTYLWNNNLNGANLIGYKYGAEENINYFLRAPNFEQDELQYEQYLYPHPLTLKEGI